MVIKEKKYIIFAIFIAIVSLPIHEFGHWLGYYFSNIKATFHFSYTQAVIENNIFGISGGPIISLTLSLLALIMFIRSKENKEIWLYLSVIMANTRLLSYLLILLFGGDFSINDEGLMANYFNFDIYSFYALSILIYILIFIILKREYNGDLGEHFRKYFFGYIINIFAFIFLGLRII